MFESAVTLDDPTDLATPADTAADAEEVGSPELTSESMFSAEIAGEGLLNREQEAALAKRITGARGRIRTILKRARRLSRLALASGGRGVVSPERDFREREALIILRFAEAALGGTSTVRTCGLDRRALRTFVTDLRATLVDYRVVRDEMVRANVRLVALLARRYHHPTLSFLDLFQEGTLGLMRAVEKYEPERKVKFSTYASWWIWQQLGRTADTQGSLIRTPVHWNQLRRRVGRAAPEDGDGLAEMAQLEGVDPARFETMAQGFRFISTDTPADDDERPLESLLADPDPTPEEHTQRHMLGERLESALETLPPREGFIVRQRFGLGDAEAQTLQEVSVHLGVSRERVRQLENRALAKLRELCGAEGLRDYLN
ncbi:MAG: sigma-70 family RNA polymerase sigma factor [Candidatus Binatia bacterium]